MDKRTCHNKAVCELQCGRYAECRRTVDRYFEEERDRKERLSSGDVEYGDKIRFNKPEFTIEDEDAI